MFVQPASDRTMQPRSGLSHMDAMFHSRLSIIERLEEMHSGSPELNTSSQGHVHPAHLQEQGMEHKHNLFIEGK